MSHYKPYPAYKNSGVEWLGWVPEHWQVKQLKYLASHIGSGKTPSGGAEVYQDAGVLFLRSQNVYEGGLRLDDAAFISDEVDEEMKGSRVKPGDVLLNITGASIGRSCLVPVAFERANVNQHVCIIRGEPPLASKWISLCLPSKAVQAQIDFSQNGAGREGLNFEQIGNMFIALPHAEEIDEIASRLDRETARIDALIEKKTRFIELLREKRQALITHAVTKGLDPNVQMKDSGVQWLGEVPEHWGVKPLKLLVKEGSTISYGIVQPGEPLDEGVPFVQTTNMSSGDFEIESLQKTTPVIAAGFPRSRLTGGEVILGIRASIGAAFVVPMHLAGVNLSRGVARIDCSSELSSHFFVAYLSSMAVDGYWQLAKQGSTFNEVSIATVKELLVPVPPREEQAEIEDMLSNATAHLNSILKKTERSIELLKERRSALISAAVTGQIDLREAV